MRTLLLLALAAIPAMSQTPPGAEVVNLTRLGSTDFQVGDWYEVVVTGWANEPVSVRTTRNSVTDWSLVLGWTDQSGHWSTEGRFEKDDFGFWSEGWTVGGLRTVQPLTYFVTGSCLPGHDGLMEQSGPYITLSCETAEGQQTFVTPSFGASFRTPDGRVIPGMAHGGTPELRMGTLIEDAGGPSGESGDAAAALIAKVIDANALDEREIGNVIQIIRVAFQNLDRKAPTANPVAAMELLKRLVDDAKAAKLKKDIAATIAFVQPI